MITAEFLGKVAAFTDQQISRVVLNGTYEITQFEIKQVSGSVVTLNYFVPASAVTEITLIELQAADGAVISSNAVQVPITADTIMVQTVEIQEVS